jgi:3-deoxy-D-manno-octulosonic-acid transferase
MFMFLYHFLWTFIIIFCLPIVPFLRKGRLIKRLALGLPSDSLQEGNIWIHALSVGEVISALPLVTALNEKYPERDIVFTVATFKGMAIARNELEGKVKVLLTMPVDFWWCVRRIVNYIGPSIFILIETDIWPALTDYLKRKGIKSILVNGRVSPRTFRSYRRFPLYPRMVFQRLDSCLMQSDLDRERLLQVGINQENVRTVGNIKFDREWIPMGREESRKWWSLLSLEPGNPVWVAGSIHRGEEKVVLEVFDRLRAFFHPLRLIVAPRKIEEADNIGIQAQSLGLKPILKTELSKNKGPYDVLILNTLGELGRVYGLGTVSFVGGSLVPIGGHNLLEPASFGCPVVFGPYTHNFVLMSESLSEAGGGLRVRDRDGLYEAMKMLLSDDQMRTSMGRRAKEFVDKNRGALERVVAEIADSFVVVG